ALAVHERSDGKRVRHVAPPGWLHLETVEGLAVRWIVFPRYGSGGLTEMCALGTADGLSRLMAHCCGLPERLTHEKVSGIVQWIEGVACFQLEFSDLGTAIEAINAHCIEPRRSNQETNGPPTVGVCSP